jgi:hypothetical protein
MKIIGVKAVMELHLDSALMSSDDEAGVSHPPLWRSPTATQLFKQVKTRYKTSVFNYANVNHNRPWIYMYIKFIVYYPESFLLGLHILLYNETTALIHRHQPDHNLRIVNKYKIQYWFFMFL